MGANGKLAATEDALRYAEQSFVSAAINGDPAYREVVQRFDLDAILDPKHRVALESVEDVWARGETPSLETVAASLLRTNRLSELSFSELSYLTDTPGSLDLEARAAELTAAWEYRQLKSGIARLAGMPGLSLEELREGVSDLQRDLPSPVKVPTLPVAELSDNWATEDLPHREFALGAAAPLGAVTLLSSMGGAGKSTLLLQVSMGLACGRALVPGWQPAGPGRDLFVALEDEELEIRRRMGRIARAFDITEYEANLIARNLAIVPLSRSDFFRMGPTRGIELGPHFLALERMLADGKYRLVVVDPVAALLAGCVEENSNEAAQFVIGRLSSILPATTALVLASHVSKMDREFATSPRGAGAWSDAARQAWGMRPLNPKESADLPYAVNARDVVVLHATKSNYSRLAEPTFLVKSQDPDSAGVLQFLDVAGATATRAKSEAERLTTAILEILTDHRCTTGELSGKHGTREGKEYGGNVRAMIADTAEQKVTTRGLETRLKEMLLDGLLSEELDPETGRRILVPSKSGARGQGCPRTLPHTRGHGGNNPFRGLPAPPRPERCGDREQDLISGLGVEQ